MSLFHVYNKFDSMDCIHVAAKNECHALELAVADGYLTKELAVDADALVVLPFGRNDSTNKYVRLVKGAV